jgi:HEPN domain-containing protein
MKRQTAKWVRKAEEDWEGARDLAARKPPLRDLACFHCQQAAEKYLKALLQEIGAAIPKTHDLRKLLNLLLPHDPTLAPLRRGLLPLSRCAVEYRYPGVRATRRRMEAALRRADGVRGEMRARLGLPL